MKRARIMLIDANQEFLNAVEYFVSRDPRVEIVGWARDGNDGYACAAPLRLNLVLMDMVSPVNSAAESIRRIKALPQAPAVIILTMHDYVEYRNVAVDAGADGFLHKADIGNGLLPLMEKVLFDVPSARP
jgi:DNA-binding NarL/FixJ family response regulator